MAIITVISFKGGVGKSIVSQNLAVSFAHKGTDVCIVDADPNKSTTMWHSYRPDDLPAVDVYHVPKNGDLIKIVNSLSKKYELVFIDCPPALEAITSRAVAKSDISIIPVATTGGNDIWATKEFLEHLEILRGKLDAPIPAYFVVNRFESNVRLHQAYIEILGEYEENYSIKTFDTRIAKRTAYGEANTQGLGVIEWENKKAIKEIKDLLKEVDSLLSIPVK
jgi:chromosome partitioning protein